MSEVFIGEIRAFGFDFTPESWISCDGQILPIANEFMALYSILGTTYGGNGRTEFGIPNLNDVAHIGFAPMMAGQGAGLTYRRLGQQYGSDSVTLTLEQIPSHSHEVNTYVTGLESDLTDTPSGDCNLSRTYGQTDYSKTAQINMAMKNPIGPNGTPAPHDNKQPYVKFHYCICYDGVYPPRP